MITRNIIEIGRMVAVGFGVLLGILLFCVLFFVASGIGYYYGEKLGEATVRALSNEEPDHKLPDGSGESAHKPTDNRGDNK